MVPFRCSLSRPFCRSGFTLIELLVVIGIISVLMGILIPVLGKARASAAQVSCSSNLRQWASAMQIYATAEHGWLPRRGQGVQTTTIINRPSDWFNALPPMMKMSSFVDLINSNHPPAVGDGSVWMCPVAREATETNAAQAYYFSYAMNMRLSTWESPQPARYTQVQPWESTVFMTEGPGLRCSILPANAAYSPVARHNGRLNIAFMDGHVASFTGTEIGCGTGDPQRVDVRWIIPSSTWKGPG